MLRENHRNGIVYYSGQVSSCNAYYGGCSGAYTLEGIVISEVKMR